MMALAGTHALGALPRGLAPRTLGALGAARGRVCAGAVRARTARPRSVRVTVQVTARARIRRRGAEGGRTPAVQVTLRVSGVRPRARPRVRVRARLRLRVRLCGGCKCGARVLLRLPRRARLRVRGE